MKKQCSHCKKELYICFFALSKSTKDGLQSWCNECKAQYRKSPKMKKWNKEWRVKNRKYVAKKAKEYYEENKEVIKKRMKEYNYRNWKNNPVEKKKMNCRHRLSQAFVSGKIRKRNTCEICHNSPAECHHEDYTKPFEFIELCRRCHIKLHEQYRDNKITA